MDSLDDKLVRALQVLAIESIETPTAESAYRGVCRWYSKAFHTPLKVVEEELDPVHVLSHFFESNYSSLASSSSDEDHYKYEEVVEDVIYPERTKKKKNKDEDWIENLKKQVAESEAKNDNSSKIKGQSLGEVIADAVAPHIKEKVKDLNLNNEDDLDLPDSGSMGE